MLSIKVPVYKVTHEWDPIGTRKSVPCIQVFVPLRYQIERLLLKNPSKPRSGLNNYN